MAACHVVWMAGVLQGQVVVAVDHQEVGASLLEQVVREVCCYLKVEEARRSLFEGLVWNLLVAEEEGRASLMECLVVQMEIHGPASVLWGVMVEVGPHEMGRTEQVEVCWVREEEHLLESLAWMENLGGPWEDQGHCYGHQQGFLEV